MRPFEYCRPTLAKVVPTGADWIHEVKYDGYRDRVVRAGKKVKVLSKSGLDWTWRFPWIAEAALRLKQPQFVIDGEICVLDVQGISDFDALHSNRRNEEAQLYAFDLVAIGGEDLRDEPLHATRPSSRGSSRAAPKAFSSPPSSPARSGPDCSKPPAGWGWKASSQSTGSAATGPGPATG